MESDKLEINGLLYDHEAAIEVPMSKVPDGVTIDPISGIISGTPTEVIPETEYTVYGNATAGGLFFSSNLEVLEDQ